MGALETAEAPGEPAPPARGWRLPGLDARAKDALRADYWLATATGSGFGVLYIASAFARIVLDAPDSAVAHIEVAAHVGLLCPLLIAAWSEGRRQVPFVFWPCALSKLGLLAVALAGSWPAFVVCVCFAYILDGLPDTPRTTTYRMNYPGFLRGQIVGRIRFVQTLARIAVAGLAGVCLLVEPRGYRVLFPVVGLLGLAACLRYRRIPEPAPAPVAVRSPFVASLGRAVALLWRDGPFARFMGLWFVFGFANIMGQTLMVLKLADFARATEMADNVATLHATLLRNVVPPLLWLVTFLFWGRILDRDGPVRLRGILNLTWSVCPLLWGLFPALPVFYGAQVIQGLTQGGTQLVWTLGVIPYARKAEEVPLYMGVHATLTGVRGVTAPYVGVLLARTIGVDTALVCAGVAMAATGLATLAFVDPREAGPARE